MRILSRLFYFRILHLLPLQSQLIECAKLTHTAAAQILRYMAH